MSAEPWVSVVVSARNDDHGGDPLRRLQIFVDAFLDQAQRHGLNSELIIVEWNPPSNRPRLAEAVRWPEESGPCRVRLIEVPPDVHQRYEHADRIGLFQMIAKNAGIRRACGEFVLCTNIDVLFTEEMVRFLASGPVEADCMYRTDRFDVSADVPLGVPVSQQLDFSRRHVLRICARWGTFSPRQIRPLTLAHRAVRRMLDDDMRSASRVYLLERLRYLKHLGTRLLGRPTRRDVGNNRLARYVADLLVFLGIRLKADRKYPLLSMKRLHTNACGDFTLLSKDRWFALRGYPELEAYSLHLDTVLCEMANVAGAREVVLGGSRRIYHIEHGSGWSPGEAERVAHLMTSLEVPILQKFQVRGWVREARRRGRPIIFNDEQWGLANDQLVEVEPIGQGARERVGSSSVERVQA